MKKLDKYILTQYLKSVTIAFVILMGIFFFHTIWLFISQLTGKSIDFIYILKFLLYYTPNLIYITLPLSVVISSIMTFGSFSEHYEFVAMKSSGISLNRAMRSIIIFMIFLSLFAFIIANNIIPIAEYKNYKFRVSITKAKPALAIKEGIFSNLGNFNIKVDEKYGENNRFLKNVIIHKINKSGLNKIIIKSKSGEIFSNDDSNFIQLILNDGYYYEEIENRKKRGLFPHSKVYFNHNTINVNLSELNKSSDGRDPNKVINTFTMMNSVELTTAIDSLKTKYVLGINNFQEEIIRKSNINAIDKDFKINQDIVFFSNYNENFLKSLPEYKRVQLIEQIKSNTNNTIRYIRNTYYQIRSEKKRVNKYIISLHDKFSLAFACMILFFAGAPLGALIRKGGIGLPMVVAIILFLTYYFLGLFAKQLGEDGDLDPAISSWISDIVMLPISIFLLRRATSDKEIFKPDGFISSLRQIIKKIWIKNLQLRRKLMKKRG